jgi:two-component SAPR family response regulator
VTAEKANMNFRQVFSSLKKDLKQYGFEDVLMHSVNSYAVDVSQISCDYYDFITGKADGHNSYHGEFMNQFSWAEQYIYALESY